MPFFVALNESFFGTYWISYTRVLWGRRDRSLFILYTAYLKANSALQPFISSENIAPINNISERDKNLNC